MSGHPDTPVRALKVGPRGADIERRGDGSLILRSLTPLGPYPVRLTERLVHWAQQNPDETFSARRGSDGQWRRLSYRQTLHSVRSIAQALLERGLGPQRMIAILSDNSLEHALLALAALHAGIPYAPISAAYSLVSTDHAKLRYIMGLVEPALVFAADGALFERAIAAVIPESVELVVTDRPPLNRKATLFESLLATTAGPAVDQAFAAITADTVAKVLFTSGSTGRPKGVTTTQRMLCSNQQMIADCMPCLVGTPPVLVDWLPWNHVFGGNHNVGIVLYNGGTLYIDDGKPVPGLIEHSIANLREIAPTAYYNVPRGFEGLVGYLEREPTLRERFFSRLQFMFYAGAGLSQPVWEALDRLALQTCGERILMITGLGATETAPFATSAHWGTRAAGQIGLPAPGVEVKILPNASKLEARFRGPLVMPGYWRQPELDVDAFDEEGFYRMGDAVRFVDPDDLQQGLLFDGRIAEDFKLSSGTWVSVGPLRALLIARGSPPIQDVVIAGRDRAVVGALVFPNLVGCRALATDLAPDASADAIISHPAVRAFFTKLLTDLARESTGSASRVERMLILSEPPSIDRNELTDKGSINQRAVLENRAALVEVLYEAPPDAHVITRDLRPTPL